MVVPGVATALRCIWSVHRALILAVSYILKQSIQIQPRKEVFAFDEFGKRLVLFGDFRTT